jgi:RimJ/RimL family protein N-acetyltransferase
MSEAPTLTAAGIVVDHVRLDDAGAFLEAQDDELRLRFGTGSPRTREEALEAVGKAVNEWAYDGRYRAWAVREQSAGPLVGWVSLRLTDHGPVDARQRGAMIEFWAASRARGRGLLGRAVQLVVLWAFANLGRDWIEASVEADNDASLRLLRKHAFLAMEQGTFHDRPTVVLRLDRGAANPR